MTRAEFDAAFPDHYLAEVEAPADYERMRDMIWDHIEPLLSADQARLLTFRAWLVEKARVARAFERPDFVALGWFKTPYELVLLEFDAAVRLAPEGGEPT